MKHAVAIVRCPDYAGDLRQRLEELLGHLGGLPAFVRPGQSVLIKPNLLTDRAPDAAVTTHPEVVRAILRMVKEAGGRPSVADSPGNAVKLETVWEKTGYRALCEAEGVPLLNLEKAGSRRFERDGCTFTIAVPVLEADVVISVPKVKTHVLTILTAAMKNLYGTVPGFQKAMFHKSYPTPDEFGRLLAAIYETHPPALNIADGIVGMDGDGPGAGRPVPFGFLAASADGVAMDLVMCRVLGIDPRSVPYLTGYLKGAAAREIELRGEPPESFRRPDTKLPGTLRARLIPRPLVRLLAPCIWIRPAFDEKCVKCGRCVKACPVSALSLANDRPAPALNAAACIGCCCCHEMCPEKAITMRMSPFLNFVRRGKLG